MPTTPATFADIVNQRGVPDVPEHAQQQPRPSYVHQTNLMGILPGCTTSASGAAGTVWPNCDPAATTGTPPATSEHTGDGTLYSVLDPLLAEYHSYYNDNATNTGPPYRAADRGPDRHRPGRAGRLGGHLDLHIRHRSGVSASEKDGVVTITNTGAPVKCRDRAYRHHRQRAAFGQAYGGELSGWADLGAGGDRDPGGEHRPRHHQRRHRHLQRGRPLQLHRDHHRRARPGAERDRRAAGGLSFADNGNGTATLRAPRRPERGAATR